MESLPFYSSLLVTTTVTSTMPSNQHLQIFGWHHWLGGHEFEPALGVGDAQGSLACCSPWDRKESDMTEWLNWTDIFLYAFLLEIHVFYIYMEISFTHIMLLYVSLELDSTHLNFGIHHKMVQVTQCKSILLVGLLKVLHLYIQAGIILHKSVISFFCSLSSFV